MGDKGAGASDKFEGFAKGAKEIVQRFVGVAIALLLLGKAGLAAWVGLGGDPADLWTGGCWLLRTDTLRVVGEALMFAAGIDLAYMLFTPKLDEAVQPLILGAAAAGLIVASQHQANWESAVAVLVFGLAIGLLFYLRERFHLGEERTVPAATHEAEPGPE